MVEVIVDGIELDAEFLDELFVAIRDRLPGDVWIPITKDHQRVIAGIKQIIDCRCYGAGFDIALHNSMKYFKKISAFQPSYDTAKPLSDHPPSYWVAQDALMLENQKRRIEKARRSEQLESNRELKKRRRK
jgi:hypothetical protein